MGLPHRDSPSRILRMTSAWSACVPCEKFRRATSMPAATRRSSASAVPLAGPMVQTIFVLRMTPILISQRDPSRVPLPPFHKGTLAGSLYPISQRDPRRVPLPPSRRRHARPELRSPVEHRLEELSRIRPVGLTGHVLGP